MQIPLLSIIIPVYNAEGTIIRAIKSILSQNSENIEVIIVNDGSTDRSFEICKHLALKEKRIRLINIKNSGVSNARNLGIENANGKYLTFLDADDYYSNNFLKVVTSEIEDDTQMLMYGYNIIRNELSIVCTLPFNGIYKSLNQVDFRKFAVTLIENELINAPWNKIYLTSYIKKYNIQFPTDLDIGEDLKFNLLVAKNIKNVKICNNTLVNYTVKPGEGLVSKFRPNRLEIRISLLNEIKDLLEYWGLLAQNQSMLDRLLLRDFMASFMDLYKNTCKYSYKEKLVFINKIMQEKGKLINKSCTPNLLSYLLKLILNTNISVIILFFAKILSLKRGFR